MSYQRQKFSLSIVDTMMHYIRYNQHHLSTSSSKYKVRMLRLYTISSSPTILSYMFLFISQVAKFKFQNFMKFLTHESCLCFTLAHSMFSPCRKCIQETNKKESVFLFSQVHFNYCLGKNWEEDEFKFYHKRRNL